MHKTNQPTSTTDEACPFCGSHKVKYTYNHVFANTEYMIACDDCWARGPVACSIERAWEIWRIRHKIKDK